MFHLDQQSVEYKLFIDYYDELLNTLSINNLSHYFVSHKIISLEDYEKIIRSSLPHETAKILLDSMLSHLLSGNGAMFSKMLSVMNQHGVGAVKEISQEIISELQTKKCADDMAGIRIN